MRLLNRLQRLLFQVVSFRFCSYLFLGFLNHHLLTLVRVVPLERRAHLKLLNFGLIADPFRALTVDISEKPFFLIRAKGGSFSFTLLTLYLLLSSNLLFSINLLFVNWGCFYFPSISLIRVCILWWMCKLALTFIEEAVLAAAPGKSKQILTVAPFWKLKCVRVVKVVLRVRNN